MKRRPTSTAATNGGYTLIEIMLAISVLLVMTAVVWPPVNRMYADFRLKQATERVRVKLAGTRIRSLDSGTIYQFRFEPGGTNYLLIPYELEAGDNPSGSTTTASTTGAMTFAGVLPETMRFDYPSDDQPPAERLTAEFLDGLAEAFQLEKLAWSPPILFYPDGTATQVAFDVVDNERQTLIRLSVRDLTGAVTVSRVESETDR